MTQDSLVVKSTYPRTVASPTTVKTAMEGSGITISELVLETGELRKHVEELGKVTFRLCVDSQGRVCSQSQSYVNFLVDFNAKKPAEEPPVEKTPVEEPPVEKPPVEEPPVEKVPVEEPPVEEPPVEKVPVEVTPAEKLPVEELPVAELQIDKAPVQEMSIDESPVA